MIYTLEINGGSSRSRSSHLTQQKQRSRRPNIDARGISYLLIYTHTHTYTLTTHQETLVPYVYTHIYTQHPHLQLQFRFNGYVACARIFVYKCECMFHTAQQSTSKQSTFRLGSIFSSWSLDFCYQYFQQRGELCIKLYTNSIYLFSSNRSVTPFNSLSLLFPSISFCVPCFLRVRMYECESVCVCFFVLVKTHSLNKLHSLYYFKYCYVWIRYTLFGRSVYVLLSLYVCVSLLILCGTLSPTRASIESVARESRAIREAHIQQQ